MILVSIINGPRAKLLPSQVDYFCKKAKNGQTGARSWLTILRHTADASDDASYPNVSFFIFLEKNVQVGRTNIFFPIFLPKAIFDFIRIKPVRVADERKMAEESSLTPAIFVSADRTAIGQFYPNEIHFSSS